MNVKSEKGAALVLTLMFIALALLFITTLSGMVVQTTKQVTTMEKRNDAELVAQMGVDYVQALLDDYERSEAQDLLTYLTDHIPKNVLIGANGDRQFEIELPREILLQDGYEVTFTSIGTAQGQTVETEGTIEITINE
ncbi:hypothetical protein [Oceanobacillus kapialis]|uniref:Type II secretion system protein n=1 Tax=Oceanobacillus kapialis TaxID=481353 RepID=A0ABW5PXM7_9BACI